MPTKYSLLFCGGDFNPPVCWSVNVETTEQDNALLI
jgi:hypothetical protein